MIWLSVIGAIVVSQQVLLRLLDVERRHPEQATLIYDLAVTVTGLDQMLFSPEVFPAQDLALLRERSSPFLVNPLVTDEEPIIPIPLSPRAFDVR